MRRTVLSLLIGALLSTSCAAQGAPSAAQTLTVAAAGGEGEVKALRSVADAFETANPGTTVVLDTVAAPGELISTLTTAFAAGSAPDVFVLNYRRLGRFADSNVIEPVPASATSGLYAPPLAAFTFDGRLLCRPANAASMVVYVNTKLFAEAGLAVPQAGWTWADLRRTAQAFQARGVSAIGFEPALVRLAPFVWSNGGELVDSLERPTVVDLSSAPTKAALTLLLDLQKTGMSATDRAAQEPEDAFTAGKLAMYLDSRRAVPGFRKTAGLAFDVAPVPASRTAVSVLHSDGFCVTKKAKNKALAQAFAAFAVAGPGANILARSGRTVPMDKTVAQSPDFLAAGLAPQHSQVFLDQIGVARALPHSARWNAAEGAAEEILVQLFAGKLTLEAAIADIASTTRAVLAKK